MNGYLGVVVTLFFICFIVIEAMLWLLENRGFKQELTFASLVFIALVLYSFFGFATEFGREHKAFLLAANNVITVAVPLGTFVLLNYYLHKVTEVTLKHFIVTFASVVFGFVWPIFALYTSCITGLDCV